MTIDTIQPGDAEVFQAVAKLAEDACIELFAAYGVKLTLLSSTAQESHEISMTGLVGFTGPGAWGMCLLGGNQGPLRSSNPTGGRLRDWVAELTNQLAGRLKRKLVDRGALVYITTPIVIRGARIEPLPRKDRRLRPSVFEAESGRLTLWVEVETSPDFILSPEPAELTMAEGEAVLF